MLTRNELQGKRGEGTSAGGFRVNLSYKQVSNKKDGGRLSSLEKEGETQ